MQKDVWIQNPSTSDWAHVGGRVLIGGIKLGQGPYVGLCNNVISAPWERKDRQYWVELHSEISSHSQGERAKDGEPLRLRSQASRHLDPGLSAS